MTRLERFFLLVGRTLTGVNFTYQTNFMNAISMAILKPIFSIIDCLNNMNCDYLRLKDVFLCLNHMIHVHSTISTIFLEVLL